LSAAWLATATQERTKRIWNEIFIFKVGGDRVQSFSGVYTGDVGLAIRLSDAILK
jgi:hypothetical protein